MLESELQSGALGLATGLEYEPGIHSETGEVIALAQVAANAGGRYISHIRSEDRWFEDSIDEIILIGRETGMPVHIAGEVTIEPPPAPDPDRPMAGRVGEESTR